MELKVAKIFNHENRNIDHIESADVIILPENGSKYVTSFFTYENIEEKQYQNKQCGDYFVCL